MMMTPSTQNPPAIHQVLRDPNHQSHINTITTELYTLIRLTIDFKQDRQCNIMARIQRSIGFIVLQFVMTSLIQLYDRALQKHHK